MIDSRASPGPRMHPRWGSSPALLPEREFAEPLSRRRESRYHWRVAALTLIVFVSAGSLIFQQTLHDDLGAPDARHRKTLVQSGDPEAEAEEARSGSSSHTTPPAALYPAPTAGSLPVSLPNAAPVAGEALFPAPATGQGQALLSPPAAVAQQAQPGAGEGEGRGEALLESLAVAPPEEAKGAVSAPTTQTGAQTKAPAAAGAAGSEKSAEDASAVVETPVVGGSGENGGAVVVAEPLGQTQDKVQEGEKQGEAGAEAGIEGAERHQAGSQASDQGLPQESGDRAQQQQQESGDRAQQQQQEAGDQAQQQQQEVVLFSEDLELGSVEQEAFGWWVFDQAMEEDVARRHAAIEQATSDKGHAAAVIQDLFEVAVDEVEPMPECKIYVLDAAKELGPIMGAPECNLDDPVTWPFSQAGRGIDGAERLAARDFQYSNEHWIATALRNSSHSAPDLASADFVFVDMHCYHTAWVSYNHPLGVKAGNADPAPWVWRTTELMLDLPLFRDTKGGAFAMAFPSPALSGFFPEDDACEELSSVFQLVPEPGNLCAWTRDSHQRNRSMVLPYLASSHLELELAAHTPAGGLSQLQRVPLAEAGRFVRAGAALEGPAEGSPAVNVSTLLALHQALTEDRPMEHLDLPPGLTLRLAPPPRDTVLFFQGGCGSPAPEFHATFAAGKILRHALVEELGGEPDVQARCACDICDAHVEHSEVLRRMRRSRFCAVASSNAQSSRRLTEAVLSGCIPVFFGAPWHALPLAQHVDWGAMALFLQVEDDRAWVDHASPRWERNALALKVWALDPAARPFVQKVPTLRDALELLRSVSDERLRGLQRSLDEQKFKFYYPALPHWAPPLPRTQRLDAILADAMCARAAAVREKRAAVVAAREEEARRRAAGDSRQAAAQAAAMGSQQAAAQAAADPQLLAVQAAADPQLLAVLAVADPQLLAARTTGNPLQAQESAAGQVAAVGNFQTAAQTQTQAQTQDDAVGVGSVEGGEAAGLARETLGAGLQAGSGAAAVAASGGEAMTTAVAIAQ